MSQHLHRRPNLFAAATLAGGLLVGCYPPLASVPEAVVTTSTTASESSSPTPSPASTLDPVRTPMRIPSACPGASGPCPENTTPVTATHQDVMAIVNPVEDIGRGFSDQDSYVGCGIDSYVADVPYDRDHAGPEWWVGMSISDSPGLEGPTIKSKNETPVFQRPGTPPQMVLYGTVVYHDDCTCVPELAGMACWNTVTDHGAFMSSMNTTIFWV